MKRFKQISRSGALLVAMLFPTIGNCEIYQVKMRDGRILKVKQYYEKGDTIFLLRYNNYIGMDRNEVVEITKIENPANADISTPEQQKRPSTKASASKKARTSTPSSQGARTGASGSNKASGDRVKDAVEPFKRLKSGS